MTLAYFQMASAVQRNIFTYYLWAYPRGDLYNIRIQSVYNLPLTQILDLAENTQPRGMTLAYFSMASAIKKNNLTTLWAYLSGVLYNSHIQSAYVLPLTEILDLAENTQPSGMTLAFVLNGMSNGEKQFCSIRSLPEWSSILCPYSISIRFASHRNIRFG